MASSPQSCLISKEATAHLFEFYAKHILKFSRKINVHLGICYSFPELSDKCITDTLWQNQLRQIKIMFQEGMSTIVSTVLTKIVALPSLASVSQRHDRSIKNMLS